MKTVLFLSVGRHGSPRLPEINFACLQLLVVDHFLGHDGFRGSERIEVAVGLEAGACGNQLADDDVFLQAR